MLGMEQADSRPHDFFPSTHWSMVAATQQPDEGAAAEALGRLLMRYHGPLTTYITRKFILAEHDAADLFQGFVARVVLDKQLIHKAQRTEGRRFRSYLLTALHRYVVSEHRRFQAATRNPPGGCQSLDEVGPDLDRAMAPDSSTAFDVAWARGVLQQAVDRMKAECGGNGRLEVWDLFEQRLLNPILHGAAPVPYEDLVRKHGWDSPAQAHNLMVTAKRMFTRCLREVVAEYALSPTDINTELCELQAILAHAG